ncbi:long-chain-acyl-CoA synthetase [Bacterioplanoides sp. SCSIO 12839]|uniref:long-chain-acyl-CoA synthetase n=1 Tax=Bacterioplanoides sp. SCSIO 12839 TaxID=2829569 RepID=UPI0021070B93|nr:long-chain-acyl-CoA synthetase [Bacterioplanoides sp. SCSIO 12839]UTW47114.1 long-chain-acyl-CoA synthetase [Bacterioplanoides sp. SCSIO 12839]
MAAEKKQLRAKTVSLKNIASQLIRQTADTPTVLKGLAALISSKPHKKKSIGLLLEKQAAKQPDHIALRDQHRQFSYAQLNQQVNRLAHFLSAQNIGMGDTVGILLENRAETLIAVLASVKLGAIASMMNTAQRGETLLHSINLVSPKLMLVGEEMLDNMATVEAQLPIELSTQLYYVRDTGHKEAPAHYQDIETLCLQQPSDNPDSTQQVTMHQPCYYIFTSGTTGLPKASVMSHYRWYKSMAGMGLASMKLKKHDVLYVSLPLYHNNALTVSLAAVLGAGATLAIARKFSVSRFWDDIRQFNATAFCYIGELCRYLLNQPASDRDQQHNIRVMIGNGLRPDIWMEFKQRFGIHHINEFYGASECNLVFTNTFNLDKTAGFCPLPYQIVQYDIADDTPRLNSAGFMIPVNKGETGLLITEVSDRQPFEGYTDAEASNKKLFRNAFKTGDCWFNTGDLVLNQGYKHIAFADRLGDTFRWKGENVATTEVESVLMEYPNISHAIVYGVAIPHTDGRAGMAAITLNCPEDEMDFAALTRHLQEKLPAYAIPLFLRLQQQQAVTGTFKYKKNELKEAAYCLNQHGDPILYFATANRAYQRLTTATEQQIQRGQLV